MKRTLSLLAALAMTFAAAWTFFTWSPFAHRLAAAELDAVFAADAYYYCNTWYKCREGWSKCYGFGGFSDGEAWDQPTLLGSWDGRSAGCLVQPGINTGWFGLGVGCFESGTGVCRFAPRGGNHWYCKYKWFSQQVRCNEDNAFKCTDKYKGTCLTEPQAVVGNVVFTWVCSCTDARVDGTNNTKTDCSEGIGNPIGNH
jgi:hypothetical protein